MNLDLFNKKFQYAVSHLMHDIHFLVSSFKHLIWSTLHNRTARWDYKTTEYLRMVRVLDSIDFRMLKRVEYLSSQNPPNTSDDDVL